MEKQTKTTATANNFNKPAYYFSLVAGIYFLVTRDISQASIFWGLGLIFDPFNIETPFDKRPFYQQAWLIVHLAITLALIVLTFVGK